MSVVWIRDLFKDWFGLFISLAVAVAMSAAIILAVWSQGLLGQGQRREAPPLEVSEPTRAQGDSGRA